MQPEHSRTDDLLRPFLQATEDEAQEILAALITRHVEPLVQTIVRRKLCPGSARVDARRLQDAEDVCREAIVSLIRRLRAARNDSAPSSIDNLSSYVAVTAYNAWAVFISCRERLRAQYDRNVAERDCLMASCEK